MLNPEQLLLACCKKSLAVRFKFTVDVADKGQIKHDILSRSDTRYRHRNERRYLCARYLGAKMIFGQYLKLNH